MSEMIVRDVFKEIQGVSMAQPPPSPFLTEWDAVDDNNAAPLDEPTASDGIPNNYTSNTPEISGDVEIEPLAKRPLTWGVAVAGDTENPRHASTPNLRTSERVESGTHTMTLDNDANSLVQEGMQNWSEAADTVMEQSIREWIDTACST